MAPPNPMLLASLAATCTRNSALSTRRHMTSCLRRTRVENVKMQKLKLSAIPDDKPVKLSIEVSAAVHRDLVAYAEVFAQEHGQRIEPIKLVPSMLASSCRRIAHLSAHGVQRARWAEPWVDVTRMLHAKSQRLHPALAGVPAGSQPTMRLSGRECRKTSGFRWLRHFLDLVMPPLSQ